MNHTHVWVIEPNTDATRDYWKCAHCPATKQTPRYVYVPHYEKPSRFLDDSLVDLAKRMIGRK